MTDTPPVPTINLSLSTVDTMLRLLNDQNPRIGELDYQNKANAFLAARAEILEAVEVLKAEQEAAGGSLQIVDDGPVEPDDMPPPA